MLIHAYLLYSTFISKASVESGLHHVEYHKYLIFASVLINSYNRDINGSMPREILILCYTTFIFLLSNLYYYTSQAKIKERTNCDN